MASNPAAILPATTPSQGIRINTGVEGRSNDTEMSDPYRGSTLPVTPASTLECNSMKNSLDNSPMDERRGLAYSESTQEFRPQNQYTGTRFESPECGANWFSRLIFYWISPLLWTGYLRPLQSNDIPLIHPGRRAAVLAASAQDAFKANCQRGDKFALFWALYGVFKREFLIGGVCRGLADVLLVVTPYTLRYLIQFVMDSWVAGLAYRDGPPIWHGVAYLAGIITMLTIQTFAHNHYMYLLGVIGGQTRAILTSAIFDKSMRVAGRGRAAAKENQASNDHAPKQSTREEEQEDWSTGHLTGLLSVDCARISQAASGIHMLWTAPFSIIVAISLLIVNLHIAALAGLALLFVGFAGLMAAVRVLFRQRKVIDKVTEARVSLTQDVLDAIRVVKYYGWGEGFARHLKDLRGRETRKLHRYTAVRNAVGAVSQGLPVMTAMISFVTYALTNSGLSPNTVFSSTALFTSLRMPLIYLPICVQGCIDSAASLLRIQEYLLTDEIEEYPLQPELEAAVEIHQATFAWDPSEDVEMAEERDGFKIVPLPTGEAGKSGFRLRQIDLTIRRGELLAVIGSVGSGKTSFLSALAGDMAKVCGSVVWGTSHATCPQQPWMHNATVRDNVTFGSGFQFDGSWYYTVLQACSLARDLDMLPHGDQTVVGERGIVLSGGQKQRISLARAMYSGKDVVLLDDPLSAVDANVGRAILNDAICGYMAARTRVLCTHDMSVLHLCDRILWMEQGGVRALDTYQNLMQNEPGFASLAQEPEGGADDKRKSKRQSRMEQKESKEAGPEDTRDQDDEDHLIQDEDQATRSVSWSVYGSLFTSSNSILLAVLCIPMLLVGSGSMVFTQLWLAWWSGFRFNIEKKTYIGVYVSLACTQTLFLYLFGLLLGLCCTRSSRVMLNKAVLRLLHAPIWFFDTTPLGRHVNRVSSDVEAMDYHLPEALRMFCISICGLIAIFALIITYFHWFAIAVGTLLVILVFLAIYYRRTAREVKRHESILRSVVFARFVEGLSGVSTLRSYGMHSNFSLKLSDAMDDMNSAVFTTLAVQRWLSLRQDAATILLVLTMGILVIVYRQSQKPSISGLVLSLMLAAMQVIQVVVREWSDVESAMNSTERLHAYATTLPQEMDDTSKPPAKDWPQTGEVHFSNTRMRYRPGLPEALKGVDLRIRGGEHVAIVGRTGAGKSSIVNGLFRLTEVSGGSISIDGSNISQVPLQDLRGGALSIIPQESTLFSGTVRSNIDPFDAYSDATIWDALRTAGLHHTLHPSDVVRDQGANLSLGERQLLALARVLTCNSRILVCDEATAALDTETDDHIQRTMRLAFHNRTVLCIAHRLRTVLWYDRICVMDGGQVAELGSPLALFQTEGGIFRQMCVKLGITEEQILGATEVTQVAEKAPSIEMSLPSPSIEVDFDLSSFSSTDIAPEVEPVARVRQRSRRGRHAMPSSIYRSSVASWAVWEEGALGWESVVR